MKYSDDLTQSISDLIQAGSSRVDACNLVGLHESTFYEYMKGFVPQEILDALPDDEARERKKSEFSESIKKAEAKLKARQIAVVLKASEEHWQASAWYLERRYPEEWAATQKLKHSGNIARNDEEAVDEVIESYANNQGDSQADSGGSQVQQGEAPSDPS